MFNKKENWGWRNVLLKIYNNPSISRDDLVNKIRIKEELVEAYLDFLEDNFLILENKDAASGFKLTEKGFDIAFNLEKIVSDNLIKNATLILSAVLFMATFVLSLVEIIQLTNNNSSVIIVYSIIILLIIMVGISFMMQPYGNGKK